MTNSYILAHSNEDLVQFTLQEINRKPFFNVHNITKRFVETHFVELDSERSVSVRIGKIARELESLGILIHFSGKHKKLYKNLHKDNLFTILNKKMEENYCLIKVKKEVKESV